MGNEASANPYLDARREWDERYGDALARARNWRLVALLSLGVAAVAAMGVAWIGSQSKIEPYVVAIDKMGDPIAMAQPVTGGAVNQRVIEAQVANWVWEWRTVLPDSTAQKDLVHRVYAMISNQAAAVLGPWYQRHWNTDAGMTINARITSVLPVAKDTWQINWTETKYQNGQELGTSGWKANIITGTDQRLAASPQAIIANPLGIYVRSITWTRVLGSGGQS